MRQPQNFMGQFMRVWYLSHIGVAKSQTRLRPNFMGQFMVLVAYASRKSQTRLRSVCESLVLSHMGVLKSQTTLRPNFMRQFMRVWYCQICG